ncbi:Protein N-acetyltransferase, RimJ/RimL family [Marininema mesophilum]|uniref:Protein N-acetyltransferase, RimJ/RimL family n=1 Tax=Marininema mesophilum TaxID=1048340 RepID=A0A1H2QY66_9BACL|nr:GNAT family protein [Marininema mesophilum]SDW12126.1 Protein N-acetyltransferase, RimJ/RimL family [Marininema mesophilum]
MEEMRLRFAGGKDLDYMARWFADEEVMYWSSGGHGETFLNQEQLADRLARMNSLESGRWWIIDVKEDTEWRAIGRVTFRDFERVVRSVTIGEKEYWGRGYGTAAIRSFIDLLFCRYNLHRIQLDTFRNNVRAIRAYEKCGFHQEGLLRQAFWTTDGYQDKVIMGMLRSEWEGKES